MTREHLFDAITNVKDTLVEEAQDMRPAKKRVNWMKWGSIAAAAALVIGAGGWALSQWRVGGGMYNRPGSSAAGGSGHDDGSTVFMHYGGPVFPMTTIEGGEGLEAERGLTYDFYQRTGSRRAGYLLVTDSYTLTNPTQEDKTVTLLYPFVSALYELYDELYEDPTPVLCADGAELPVTIHAGGYSGGFQGVPDGSGQVSEELLNLEQLDSWEEYKALLSDGRYLEQALEGYPDLSDTPVIVYKFFDYFGPEADNKAGIPNPSIRAGFDLDYDRTTVLSYGFHGARWDRENGTMIQEFSIPRPGSRNYGEPYFLFVIGDDIQNLTTGGYVTGGTDPDTKTLDGCGVSVERYESDLESALRGAAELMYAWGNWAIDNDVSHRPDFEMYFGLMKEFLCSYGALSESDVARYDNGWLEFMDFQAVDRVFYLETEVTVPAGGSVTVEASFTKEPSYDHYCAHTENQGISGYDMVTKLGTNLDFTVQTAEAVNTDAVEIVRQNFGFDWENGVNKVTLDQSVEHYYLEVRALAEE